MGRNAKRKKTLKELHGLQKQTKPEIRHTLCPPPVGVLKASKEGNFADGTPFEIDIVQSSRTNRFLVCLDADPLNEKSQPSTITVWDTLERAYQGGEQVLRVLPDYTHRQLMNFKLYQEFLNKLSDDDDQVLGVFQNGKFFDDENTRLEAMRNANKILIDRQSPQRYRVNGETVL